MLYLHVDCELGTGILHETRLSGAHTEFICEVPEIYAPQTQAEFEHLLKEQGIENAHEFKLVPNERIKDLIKKAIIADTKRIESQEARVTPAAHKAKTVDEILAPTRKAAQPPVVEQQQVAEEKAPPGAQPKKSSRKAPKDITAQKIVRLSVSNVKRISAAEITPEGDVVTIGGKNGEGKTSILDAIEMAFAGKDAFTERPIRDGEKSAKIVAELDDIIVTRTITPSGGELKVTSKDGEKYSSPQELLNALTGKLSFDPMGFAQQCKTAEGRKAQLITLQKLVGLDFTENEAEHKRLYEERTQRGYELKQAQAFLSRAPSHADAGSEEVSIGDLTSKLTAAQQVNAVKAAKTRFWEAKRDALKLKHDLVANLEKQLGAAKHECHLAGVAEIEARKASETAETANEDAIVTRMQNIEVTNRKVRENRYHADAEKKVQACNEAYDQLTSALTHLAAEKTKALAETQFPVPGLSFDETGVLVNNLPFSEASMAEQIRVSVAMGIALNPTLKIILIRDGSLLDKTSLGLVAQMAHNSGVQVWIEKVSDDGEGCSIIIENGAVKQ